MTIYTRAGELLISLIGLLMVDRLIVIFSRRLNLNRRQVLRPAGCQMMNSYRMVRVPVIDYCGIKTWIKER